MGVFTLFSVYFVLKSLLEDKILYVFLGGVLSVFAFLSKGAVGIFPLVVPFIYWIVFNKSKRQYKPLLYSIILILFSAAIIYLLFILVPASKVNIFAYFEQQLLPALNNKREITTDARFSIIGDLLLDLSFPIVLLTYVAYTKWKQNGSFKFRFSKEAIFFFLVAISASLPLIISLKQRKFYLIPSIPFYILAIGFLIVPFFVKRIHLLSHRFNNRLKTVSIIGLILVFGVSILLAGKYSRDEQKLSDVHELSKVIPKESIISTTKELWYDWGLVAYMSRVGQLSLDYNIDYEYLLVERNVNSTIPRNYKELNLNLLKYKLYRRVL